MDLPKPQTAEELLPPFEVVGEPGWDSRLRAWLADFGLQFPAPSTLAEVAAAEVRLGLQLPADWGAFLLAFGPINLEGFRLSPSNRIKNLDGVWFRSHLSASEQARLPQLIQIGECGSSNYIGYDAGDGWVCECCHDPGGLWDWCPSFSDFLRLQLVRLWSGSYGWPDPEVGQLSDELTGQWLAKWGQQRLASQGATPDGRG